MVRIVLSLALMLLAALPVRAQVFLDDFNRADSSDLGPNWQVIGTGSATRVISNQAGNIAAANNLSLVTTANFSAPYTSTTISADIFHSVSAGLSYVALALGHNGNSAAGNGLFIKLQSNSGAVFDNIGFYTGINQSTTSFWSDPPVFFPVTTPFSSAHMTVSALDASTIQVALDTDFNGTPDQIYTRHLNVGTMTFGTQAGIGVFGTLATADNFSVSTAPVPEPGSLLLIGCGAIFGGRIIRRRRN
jgi:PEP-CTERM motif-containing protein